MSGVELERLASLMDGPSDARNKEVLSYIKQNRATILRMLKEHGEAEVRISSGEKFKIRNAA